MRKLLILIVLILTVSQVSAFSVSPATRSYVAPVQDTYDLRITNTADDTITLNIFVDGDAQDSIQVQEGTITITPEERTVVLPVMVQSQSGLAPGKYDAGIVLEEQSNGDSGNTVTAVTAARHRIVFTVPADGKFVSSTLHTSALRADEPIALSVIVKNIGTEDISSLDARIEVRSPTNELLETLKTQQTSLRSGGVETLSTLWNPEVIGEYVLQVTVNFDGLTQTITRTLRVGDLSVRLGKFVFGDFRLGEVGKIELPITSEWNERIRGVYAEYEIYQGETVVQTFTTASESVAPFGDATLEGFWNTADRETGPYRIKATVYYGDKEHSTSKNIVLGLNGIEVGNRIGFWGWTGFIILILIIILITWQSIKHAHATKRQKR